MTELGQSEAVTLVRYMQRSRQDSFWYLFVSHTLLPGTDKLSDIPCNNIHKYFSYRKIAIKTNGKVGTTQFMISRIRETIFTLYLNEY